MGGLGGYAISQEQARTLRIALDDLLVLAEADAVFMTDYGGNILASSAAREDSIAVETVAALAAGSFAATRELSSRLGENNFHSILHQGEDTNIYLQCMTGDFLVLVVFGRNATAGLVRLYAEKTARELEPVLSAVDGQSIAEAGGGSARFSMDTDADVFDKA